MQYVDKRKSSYSGETVEEYPPDGEMLANEDRRYYYDARSRLVSVSEWRYTDLDNQIGRAHV